MRAALAALAIGAFVAMAMPTSAQETDPADLLFWQSITGSQDPAAYAAYLEAFPNGRFAPLARLRAGGAAPAVAAPPPAAPAAPAARIQPVGPAQPVPAAPPAPSRTAGAMDAMEFSKESAKLGRAGMFAKYRGQTLTIQGRFQKLLDLGIGDTFWVQFIKPQEFGVPKHEISCTIPRGDTKAYDTFATMAIGTNFTISGPLYDVQEVFGSVTIQPCAVINPPLHAAKAAASGRTGPATPPNGSYACQVGYTGAGIGSIKVLGSSSFTDISGERRSYSFDKASGRVSFPQGILGGAYVGYYEQPGPPSSGATIDVPQIRIAPAERPTDYSVFCIWRG